MSVESPCIKICKLDANMICVGCRRTVEEITDWYRLTDAEKQRILENINARLAQR